jgi:hypothetical protein
MLLILNNYFILQNTRLLVLEFTLESPTTLVLKFLHLLIKHMEKQLGIYVMVAQGAGAMLMLN